MKRILAILCVMYAGSAMAGSAGQSLTGGQAIGSVDGLGSSADTEVTYNCSGAICGDPDLTFDGTTTTMAAQIILPNDGSNSIYEDDNPAGAGGFADCAANPPSTNDGRLNLDSNDAAGFQFLCLDDGLNYQLPRFEQDDSLLGPTATTGWQINSSGIARFKQLIFIQPDEDATQSFGRIQTNFTGTGITSWDSKIRVGVSYTNGSTMENNKKFIEFTKDGTDFFSLDPDSGGGTAFHIWDLDNTNKVTVTPPDAISSDVAVTWPTDDGALIVDNTRIEDTVSRTEPTPVDASDHYWFKMDYTIVLTGLECIVDGTTSIAITIQHCDSDGTSCVNTDAAATCDADGATDVATTSISADRWTRILYAAPTDSPTFVNMTLQYTRVANP